MRPKRPYASGPLSCRVCLSVTLVYCGQTVGRIKVKLGVQAGFGPGHTVIDGDTAPTERGTADPHIRNLRPYNPRSMSIVAKRLDGIK